METDTPQMTDGFTLALEKVQGWATGFYSILPNILVGLVILLIFTVFAYTISKAITAYFKRRDKIDLGNIVSDIGFWLFMVFGLLVALTIMIPSMNPADLVASFGIGSIAVGLIAVAVFGWLVFDLGGFGQNSSVCKDHLGLPVPCPIRDH